MSKRTIEIIAEERVYGGHIKIDKATIKDVLEDGSESTYTREKASMPDAVAGLIYNTDTECVVLVEQYRYPTQIKNKSGMILEALAGTMIAGEDPKKTFIRESFEESGYALKEKNVELCSCIFVSPGYTTERVFLFLATATNKDKVQGAGGGLKEENENIIIHEIHYLQFKSMIDTFSDGKTKLLAYEAHYKNLFDRK